MCLILGLALITLVSASLLTSPVIEFIVAIKVEFVSSFIVFVFKGKSNLGIKFLEGRTNITYVLSLGHPEHKL